MGIDWDGPTADVIAGVLASQPHIAAHLDEAHAQVWNHLDPVLLELVRLRIAMLLGNEAELAVRTPAAVSAGLDEDTVSALASWPTSPRFGPREQACMAFVEQWVIDVATLTDQHAAAVADVLGPEGLAAFAAAVLVLEQRQRLRLAWSRLFPTEEER